MSVKDLIAFNLGFCNEMHYDKWDCVMDLCKSGVFKSKDLMLTKSKINSVEDVSKTYEFFHGFRDKLHYENFKRILDLQSPEDSDVVYPFVLVDSVSGDCPYIAYNRQAHGKRRPLLWPLSYHISESLHGFEDSMPFKEKKSKIVFRGALSSNIEDKIIDGIYKSSRFMVVEKWLHYDNDKIDLALNKIPDSKNENFLLFQERINKCIKPTLPKKYQMSCKYILCLEGADISTSVGWVLASNCVPIIPYPYVYETYFFYNLRPWVHFIPCDPKCESLDSILEWAENNQSLCENISRNGQEYATFVFDPVNIKAVEKSIVKKWKLRE